jgi:hypothetical protein
MREVTKTMTSRSRNRWKVAVAALAALLALNAALLLVQPGLALPRSLANYFYGAGMIRAEVVVRDAEGIHDWRLDQGRILRVAPARSMLRIVEHDGRVVELQIALDARIELHGRPVPLAALRRGVRVLVVRDGESPAEVVLAGRR